MSQSANIPPRILSLYESVARQHALFTRLLPPDLRRFSVDYYLLYRMIDSIEDSPLDDEVKAALLRGVRENLPDGIREARDPLLWCMHLTLAHKSLFAEAEAILDFHFSIDAMARNKIEQTGSVMADGMLDYAQKRAIARNSGIAGPISNFSDLDDYCYFVAGCVGELNTDLFFADYSLDSGALRKVRKFGCQFGKYLQLINIIRDCCEDEQHRRSHFPRTIEGLLPQEQIIEIVFFARSKEDDIREYISMIQSGKTRKYCSTLFDIARLHYEHFLTLKGNLTRDVKPPAFKVFQVLPAELKFAFMRHKYAKAIRKIVP